MDCDGVELELLPRKEPNAWGVHEMRWLSCSNKELRDRERTRWPLLRTVCALLSANSPARQRLNIPVTVQASSESPFNVEDGTRSRSRSPRLNGSAAKTSCDSKAPAL